MTPRDVPELPELTALDRALARIAALEEALGEAQKFADFCVEQLWEMRTAAELSLAIRALLDEGEW